MPKDEKSSEKPANPEVQQLQELYGFMVEKGLETVELKDPEGRIRLVRRSVIERKRGDAETRRMVDTPTGPFSSSPGPSGAGSEGSSAPPASPNIASPLAGVFYRASSPSSLAFVKEGDTVDPGQTLCIVEAMKVMNEIKAESHCRITKIMVENARAVTAGQVLFYIEPV
jgi:acetyl-CoA carboxylase biotin carboxyl carrier protein